MKASRFAGAALVALLCAPAGGHAQRDAAFAEAAANARAANEALVRSQRVMYAWLEHADPRTGLLPRNLLESTDIWNARDAAADLYPYFVLTAWFTDPDLYAGRMQEILLTETALISRVGRLADTYSFSKQGFDKQELDMAEVQFGSAEYMKDGLMPITEWLGVSPWRARMLGLLDDSWRFAAVETPYGRIPSTDVEVNGDQLQVLNRMYWVTRDERYLDYAERLGDFYLLGKNHPTRDFERLRLRDHGNEVVSGLVELYATLREVRPAKAARYREPVHAMLDRILAVGRNADGLFYNVVDPRSGVAVDSAVADNFGYILNGFHAVYQIDGKREYREAVRRALTVLNEKYRGFDWENGGADGDADAVEGALNLYNREPVPAAAEWIEFQIRFMWSKQDSAHRANAQRFRGTGVVEGGHPDGNFNRTSLMYALWKTQGTSAQPWRRDLLLGAVREGDAALVSIAAAGPWAGKLRFDSPRHRTQMGMPRDWPRMNQFPEWFTVEAGRRYRVSEAGGRALGEYSGAELVEGIAIDLPGGAERRLVVAPL